MECFTSLTSTILINGSASKFFNPSRGLRQGYPLFPLLFLIIEKGLSMVISEAKRVEVIKDVNKGVRDGSIFIASLFGDDVL